LVLVKTGQVLHEASPPRNDTARQIRWNTADVAGHDVRIECVDGDSGTAYAWIAVGEFDPNWIQDLGAASALSTSLSWINRLGLREYDRDLENLLRQDGLSRSLRIEVARTLASLRGNQGAATALQFMQSTNAPSDFVATTIEAICDGDVAALRESTKSLCKRLSSAQQREFAIAWAERGAEIGRLVKMAQDGWLSREVFADPTALQVISPRLNSSQQAEVAALTANIDPAAPQLEALSQLKKLVSARTGDPENGHRIYTQHCAACHQLRGEGAVVGPQLDGAASRSVERLLEDVVTPDRNIDAAFRTTSFLLEDGKVVVGLVTAETDDEITVVQSNGKPTTIETESVELRRDAGRSLMPGNMAEVLSAAQFSDLITYVRGGK
jgi:putative heme-binding domain-containing protein